MECPKCKNNKNTKDGLIKEKQGYRCKNCNYRYTVVARSSVKPIEIRQMALKLYLEGLGFRAIGRILEISYGTVYQWIKQWGSQVDYLQRKKQ